MRRSALLALLLLSAPAASAFDPTAATETRVCVLRTDAGEDLQTMRVASLMRTHLARELRRQGLDAFETHATYDDLARGEDIDGADVYVEFVAGDADDDRYGGVAVTGRHGGVEMGVVVSRVAAGIRLYDGRTLELIDEFRVQAHDSAVLPTAIGLGGRHLGIWIGVPISRAFRHRAVAREAARDAAETIAEILVPESD